MRMREALISFPMFGDNFVLDPPAYFSIGNFNIYMYGVVIAIGFLLAVLYVSRTHSRFGIDMDDVYDLVLFAVPTAVVGARLYYVVFNWSAYAGDFASIFAIRDGGLAIYGGVIGAVIALWLRSRAKKISLSKVLDVAAFGLLIGQSVGRWGNFFNREAYGYETDVFCRMGLTLGQSTVYVHPTFLYESLWNLAGFLLLHFHSKKHRRYYGQYFILYVFWYGLGRAFIEGLRTDSLWLIPDVIRVSQLLAAVSALAALIVYIINNRRIRKGLRPAVGTALSAGTAPTLDESDIMGTEAVDAACEDTENEEAPPEEESREENT